MPKGSRVQVEGAESRENVADAIRRMAGDWVRVLTRPFNTCRAPICDKFCLDVLALGANAEHIARQVGLSKGCFLDKMLLCLYDALFLKQSCEWTARRVANMRADETPEIAKWFMRGQQVGAKPIFDGARCWVIQTEQHFLFHVGASMQKY